MCRQQLTKPVTYIVCYAAKTITRSLKNVKKVVKTKYVKEASTFNRHECVFK